MSSWNTPHVTRIAIACLAVAFFLSILPASFAQDAAAEAEAAISAVAEAAPAAEAAPEATAELDTGSTAWMLVSCALVLLMMPGLAMFYGGLVRNKNVLGTMMHSFGAMGLVGVTWVVCGYALAFGDKACGGWIGFSSDLLFLRGIDGTIADGGYPDYVFAMFQGMFAIITPAILAGSFAERVSFRGFSLFTVLWVIFVYCPLCYWVWGGGFLGSDGAIDFAGGTVVHISSGVSGLIMALIIGKRKGHPNLVMSPNSMVMTMIGAGLLWVGWFGFNAGSAGAADLAAAQALAATHAAAAAGAVVWMLIEGVHYGKATSLGVVSGLLAGLVVITPAAGSVSAGSGIILGALASFICYFGVQLKNKFGFDDTLDAFGIHGIAGMAGAILLVFFLREGAMNKETLGEQLYVQLFSVVVTIAYAGFVTIILGLFVHKTIGLRLSEEDEVKGMDQSLHGEHGYDIVSSVI